MTGEKVERRTGILIILDGFGISPTKEFNAVAQAKTPNLDYLLEHYVHSQLDASESQVGLPKGFMGNSEVGHLNIGAGRIVFQDFSQIAKAIDDETFYQNPAFTKLLGQLKGQKKGTLHLMGLVSDGGVHSHISHLFALIQLAKRSGIERVAIHVFTDGRDTSPTSGVDFVSQVQNFCRDVGVGFIATIIGRFYAMDRDNRWERTEAAYHDIISAGGEATFTSPVDYVRQAYDQKITDEFIPPAHNKTYSGVADGDAIIFFNFRADRARQITRAITQVEFAHFRREHFPTLCGFVCMTPYDATFKLPAAYEKPKVPDTLGEIVSRLGWGQLRIAETEKYAHVTYFFNGGDERIFEGEKRVLIPSPRDVKTYDEKPEMSAAQVTESLLHELGTGAYQFAVVNFANCDMVGHTGNLQAAVRAVETVDGCVGQILKWVEKESAFAILTADHGNCEVMQDPKTGHPLTSHTLLPVPFVVIDPRRREVSVANGRLCDIAPSMLALWGIEAPATMTGKNLVQLKPS